MIFGNLDIFGKCKILIDPWGTLKWGKNLKNSGKIDSLFRKSRFLPPFSEFSTLTFPKKSTPGPPEGSLFPKMSKIFKKVDFSKNS